MRTYAFTLLLALTPCVSRAQAIVTLVKPEAQFPDPFTRIFGINEMANGKVLVSDLQDKVVQMIDFASGKSEKVGREGQGPTEYAMPAALYPMPKGETWLNDMLGRRFLVIDAAGKPVRTVPLPGSGGGGFIAMMPGGGGADQNGHLYFQSPPFSPGSGPGSPPPDSLAILRWDGVKASMDTTAWVVMAKGNISGGGGGGRVMFRIGGAKMFTPEEHWGVAEDGSVARVMHSPYRVVWYGPKGGAPAAGPIQPYTPLPVTQSDKTDVIEAQKKQRPMLVTIGGPGGGRASPPPSGGGGPQLPAPEFADTKPPFYGNNSVVVSPEGEVWVERTQTAGTKNPLYDVFDRAGKLVRKVTLNPRSVVRGFGKGTVYVVRTDDDDLQYVERYRR